VIICQVEAPSVSALMICSSGISLIDFETLLTMIGAMPTTMRAIFAVSPRPRRRNRIGRTASGGISEIAATTGANAARASGRNPMAIPSDKARNAEMPSAMTRRFRLAEVSVQRR
jgi:hypothetical protein